MTAKYTNPRFNPVDHGFKFINSFENAIYFGPFGWAIRTGGRRGGMAYSSLDYFYTNKTIPSTTETLPDGDYIGDYILKRQFDSFGRALYPECCRSSIATNLLDHRKLQLV